MVFRFFRISAKTAIISRRVSLGRCWNMRPINAYLPLILNTRIDAVALGTSRIDFTVRFFGRSRGVTPGQAAAPEEARTHPRNGACTSRKRKIPAVAFSAPQTGDVEQRCLCQIFRTLFFARRRCGKRGYATRAPMRGEGGGQGGAYASLDFFNLE